MNIWTALIMIVAIWAVVQMYTYRRDRIANVKYDEDGYPLPSTEDQETRQEIEELRERIKVLERIATDGNSPSAQETKRISAEIEALRDRQGD